jgi:hypothetical protein
MARTLCNVQGIGNTSSNSEESEASTLAHALEILRLAEQAGDSNGSCDI